MDHQGSQEVDHQDIRVDNLDALGQVVDHQGSRVDNLDALSQVVDHQGSQVENLDARGHLDSLVMAACHIQDLPSNTYLGHGATMVVDIAIPNP